MRLVQQYFATARERYKIMLRRQSFDLDAPKYLLTEDPVFRQWRFCNVHREDDRVTKWFRENVRDRVSGQQALESTIAFRWFNTIEAGVRLLSLLWEGWDSQQARERMQGVKPVVSGAYIIVGWPGYDKLEGVIKCIQTAIKILRTYHPWSDGFDDRYCEPVHMFREQSSLRSAHQFLSTHIPYMGRFTAYEAVTDLRHTDVLEGAGDIMSWASAGPGCARGLSWVQHGESGRFNYGSQAHQDEMNILMRELLAYSRDGLFWPQQWRPWEMREVEHWSCEFDKYKRAERGDRMKRRFR